MALPSKSAVLCISLWFLVRFVTGQHFAHSRYFWLLLFKLINIMASVSASTVAQALNQVRDANLASAVSDDGLQELLQDYFWNSDDGSDDEPSDDEFSREEERSVETTHSEDEGLIKNDLLDVSADQFTCEDQAQEMLRCEAFTCNCKFGEGHLPCSSTIGNDQFFEHRVRMAELENSK